MTSRLRGSPPPSLVKGFLATLPVLGLDEASVQISGEAKALLELQGQRLADADLLSARSRPRTGRR